MFHFQTVPIIQTSAYMGPPRYAVFADEEGKPYFEPLVALAMAAFNPEKPEMRTMVGMTMGDAIQCADVKANFVGWERNPTDEDDSGFIRVRPHWLDKCRAKRNAITAAEQAKKQEKLWTPGKVELAGVHEVKS